MSHHVCLRFHKKHDFISLLKGFTPDNDPNCVRIWLHLFANLYIFNFYDKLKMYNNCNLSYVSEPNSNPDSILKRIMALSLPSKANEAPSDYEPNEIKFSSENRKENYHNKHIPFTVK